jgi:ankyrin repeat protein
LLYSPGVFVLDRFKTDMAGNVWRPKICSSSRKQLFEDIAVGDTEAVEAFLDAGGDVNSLNNDGVSILCYAIRNGNADVVSKILEYSPDLTINPPPPPPPPPPPRADKMNDARIAVLVVLIVGILVEGGIRLASIHASDSLKSAFSAARGFGAFQFQFKILAYDVVYEGIWKALEKSAILTASLVLFILGSSSGSDVFSRLCHEGLRWSFIGWVFRTALFYVFGRIIFLVKRRLIQTTPTLQEGKENELGMKALNEVLKYGGNGEEMMLSLLDHGLPLVITNVLAHRIWIWAACWGHIRVLNKLISAGINVNAWLPQDQENFIYPGTALCNAAWRGHYDSVKLLLDHGAVIDETGGLEETPLLLAMSQFATYPSLEPVIASLLEHGADVTRVDRWGRAPLFYATSRWGERILDLLLNAKADPDVQDKEGKLPIHGAARTGSVEVIKRLIRAGSRVNVPDRNDSLYFFRGMLPLHYAAEHEHCDAIRALVDADPSTVLAKDANGHSALTWAIWSGGRPEASYILIDAGSDVNDGGGTYGSPLLRASVLGDPEVMRRLIEKGANVNFQFHDSEDGETPLFGTLHRHYGEHEIEDAVDLLLTNGADVTIRNKHGKNVLQKALERNSKLSVLKALAETHSDLSTLLSPDEESKLRMRLASRDRFL